MQQGYEAWKARNFNEAILAYENVLSLKPTNIDALNFLGVIYEEIGYPEKAEGKYLTAIAINQRYLPAYLNLGLLYWNKGDLEKATYFFQKRVEYGRASDPWTVKAKAALASIKLKKSAAVEQEVTIAIEHEKAPAEVVSSKKADLKEQQRLKIINQSLDKVNLQQAPQETPQAIEPKPQVVEPVNLEDQKAQLLFIEGQKLATAKKYQEAIEKYDQALKINPGNPQMVQARVDAFLQWKQQATAE